MLIVRVPGGTSCGISNAAELKPYVPDDESCAPPPAKFQAPVMAGGMEIVPTAGPPPAFPVSPWVRGVEPGSAFPPPPPLRWGNRLLGSTGCPEVGATAFRLVSVQY